MRILGVRGAPVVFCVVGMGGATGRAGTAGELLGAHDVAVAWVGRQRLGLLRALSEAIGSAGVGPGAER